MNECKRDVEANLVHTLLHWNFPVELRFDLGLDTPGRQALGGEALGCEGHHFGLDIDNAKTRGSKKGGSRTLWTRTKYEGRLRSI